MTQLFSLILIRRIVIYPVDSAIHLIKIYPVDDAIVFPNTYPLDSDLSGDSAIQRLNNRDLYQRVNIILPAMLLLTQTLCGNNDLHLTTLKYCQQGLLFK